MYWKRMWRKTPCEVNLISLQSEKWSIGTFRDLKKHLSIDCVVARKRCGVITSMHFHLCNLCVFENRRTLASSAIKRKEESIAEILRSSLPSASPSASAFIQGSVRAKEYTDNRQQSTSLSADGQLEVQADSSVDVGEVNLITIYTT